MSSARETWRVRVADRRAVIHGEATRAIDWERDEQGRWHMRGARWELPA